MKLGKINFQAKVTRAGGLVAGSIAATAINNKLVPMVMKEADTKTSNLITMGIGLFGPEILNPKKSKSAKPGIIDAVFDGIVAASGVNLLNEFAPDLISKVSGIGNPSLNFSEETINGYSADVFAETVNGLDRDPDMAVMGIRSHVM